MAGDVLTIVPGQSLGVFALGSSLQDVLTTIQVDKAQYPAIDLRFSPDQPITTPVIVTLPQNGIRLRFDGRDQRLRLIEVTDFQKLRIAYKGSELLRRPEEESSAQFKRVYQLFGASYPGEYIPPSSGRIGTYVLSWPGIAFNFPLQHSAYAPEKDHVSLLGSHVASNATSMALFDDNSWSDARSSLFVKTPNGPRNASTSTQHQPPAELEEAIIVDAGNIQFLRRAPAMPFAIILGQTTPQDLLTELGAPQATHRRAAQETTTQPTAPRPRSTSRTMSNGRVQPTPPSSYSSTGTDTFETDFDSGDADDDLSERASHDTFWCYFNHGLDILVGLPNDSMSTANPHSLPKTPLTASPHPVVLKVVVHGNVPGSYAFNRHRRLRWSLDLSQTHENDQSWNSETPFDDLKPHLMQSFAGIWPEAEMGRGKVVNRTWGADPTDSTFFLPDADQDLVEGSGSEQWLGNTKLYSYPGMTFEVGKNGAVYALTIS